MNHQDMHTITALNAQKKKPWRTSIFIDGEFWCSCNTDTVIEIGLYENQQLDIIKLEQLSSTLEKRRALDRGILLLSYRARSSHELGERLKQAGFSDNAVTYTISELTRLEYLDDLEFSRSWAKDRMSLKLFGSKRIKQELKGKGVREDIINDILENTESDNSEIERARLSALKKMPTLKNLDKNTAFRRLSQFLARRGYGTSLIYDVCNSTLESRVDEDAP